MKNSFLTGLSSLEDFGTWCGNLSAILFFLVELPQIILNFKRKSTEGFSSLAVIFRLFGLSFQFSFGIKGGLPVPTFIAACFLIIENIIFIFQFAYYQKKKLYLLSILLVFIGITINSIFPSSINVTKWFYSAIQVIGYIPYIMTILSVGSTLGISLLGQHLNFIGFILGVLMCVLSTTPSDTITWLFYLLSGFQASSVFIIAMNNGEYRIIDGDGKSTRSDVIKLSSFF